MERHPGRVMIVLQTVSSLVLGAWFLVRPWSLVLRPWSLVLRPWFFVPGPAPVQEFSGQKLLGLQIPERRALQRQQDGRSIPITATTRIGGSFSSAKTSPSDQVHPARRRPRATRS